MKKYDCYLRGKFLGIFWASCATHALNLAHANVGGDVRNGTIVVVRTDERGQCVTEAREQSKA